MENQFDIHVNKFVKEGADGIQESGLPNSIQLVVERILILELGKSIVVIYSIAGSSSIYATNPVGPAFQSTHKKD